MSYQQITDSCFTQPIGGNGLSREGFEAALKETASGLEMLRAGLADGSLPFLALPALRDDLAGLSEIAGRYRGAFEQVVVLGTGGSSLGGRAFCALAENRCRPGEGGPALSFMDNIDPDGYAAIFNRFDPAKTGFLVISKSGGTAETLTQFLTCYQWMASALGEEAAGHFTLIVGPGDNPLRNAGTVFGIPALDHDPGLGGRFSVLSLVGILPGMIAGLDPVALREGAAAALSPITGGREPADCPPAVGAALAKALHRERGVSITVMMPYLDQLVPFSQWFQQLWAESLGKDGKGMTPVRALGTVDQHSQLQLFLDGPQDKMFTLVSADMAGRGETVSDTLAHKAGIDWLAGKRMGDLLAASQKATTETLAAKGCPVRRIEIGALSEHSLGALFMHFMLETVLAAHLLGVNAFDQPAVEEGKRLARKHLAGEG